jgi:ATP-dependent DNA helicase RecG
MTYWDRVERGCAAAAQRAGQGLDLGGLSSNPGALSSNLGPQGSNPRQPEPQDDPLADPRRQALLKELPSGLATRVGTSGQRRPHQEVQDLVVALCELRPWRAEEIAALPGRNAETVRQNYLRPLLRAGRIAMTRPDKPNDPDQAYHA